MIYSGDEEYGDEITSRLYSDDDPEPTFEDAKKAGARPVYGAYTCVDCRGSGVVWNREEKIHEICASCDGCGAI